MRQVFLKIQKLVVFKALQRMSELVAIKNLNAYLKKIWKKGNLMRE